MVSSTDTVMGAEELFQIKAFVKEEGGELALRDEYQVAENCDLPHKVEGII